MWLYDGCQGYSKKSNDARTLEPLILWDCIKLYQKWDAFSSTMFNIHFKIHQSTSAFSDAWSICCVAHGSRLCHLRVLDWTEECSQTTNPEGTGWAFRDLLGYVCQCFCQCFVLVTLWFHTLAPGFELKKGTLHEATTCYNYTAPWRNHRVCVCLLSSVM